MKLSCSAIFLQVIAAILCGSFAITGYHMLVDAKVREARLQGALEATARTYKDMSLKAPSEVSI